MRTGVEAGPARDCSYSWPAAQEAYFGLQLVMTSVNASRKDALAAQHGRDQKAA